MLAYILGQLDRTKAREVVETIDTSPLVEDVHVLFGEWDFIIKLHTSNQEEVTEFVIDELRSNDDISLTSTLIVAE